MTCDNYYELIKNEIGEVRYNTLVSDAHRLYRHQQIMYRCGRGTGSRITLEEFTERYILEKVKESKK